MDVLGLKPRLSSGTLSLAAANRFPSLGVAQRLDAERVAGDEHIALGVEQHQAVRPVEPLADAPHHVHQPRPPVAGQLAADLVHDDFGVVLAGQVVVGLAEQLVAQLLKIRELPVEAEREPFAFFEVVPLEGLGIAAVLGPAGGVADVADRRPAGILLHQAFGLAAVRQAKHLGDRADILVRL